jgi:uncharacterized membrane protein
VGYGFSIGEALGFGWATLRDRFGTLIGLIVVSAIITVIPQLLSQGATQQKATALALLFGIVAWVAEAVVALGWTRITLKLHDGQNAEMQDLIEPYPLLWKYIGASILAALAISIGFLVLFVPGVILAIRLGFFPFAIVDGGAGPVEALQKSWDLTRGSFWHLLTLAIALACVNVLGALALGIGLLVTVPMTAIAMAYVYRRLPERAPASQAAFAS